MNVTDVDSPEVEEGVDRLEAIFARQDELHRKYAPIERRQGTGYGLLGDRKWNIHAHHTQEVVKNYAWRVTEELMESYEAYGGPGLHAHEEIADAIHFLVELFLLQGIDHVTVAQMIAEEVYGAMPIMHDKEDFLDYVVKTSYDFMMRDQASYCLQATFFQTIYWLGMACNCLKQKPWKQSHVKTDVNKFEKCLARSFRCLMASAVMAGMNAKTIFDLYFRKSEVNKFRIRSKY